MTRQSNEEYHHHEDDHAEEYAPPGRRDAQPNGRGAGYQDPDIPF
jgi:hypothetical protein